MTTSGLIAILALVVDLITIYISLKEKKLSFLSKLTILFVTFIIIVGGTMWVKGYPDNFQGFLRAVGDYLPIDIDAGSSSGEDNLEGSGSHNESNDRNEAEDSEKDVKEIFSRVKEGYYDDDDLNSLIEYFRENVGTLRENYWSEGDPQLPYISPTYTYIECSTLTEMEVKISDLVESHLEYDSVFSIETGYQEGEPGVCVKAYNEISPPWEEPMQEIQRGLVELLDQDFTLELNETDTCSIFVPENGRVTISVRTYFDNYHYVYLKDRNMETVDYKPLSGKGVDFPETASFKYDLCAGEYSVVIESINDCWGDYHISASYVPSITGAKEITNVDFRSAQEITGQKIDGFVSSGNTWLSNIPEAAQVFENYYYYEPNTSGDYELSVVPISDEGHFLCIMYDNDYREKEKTYGGSFSLNLERKKYYFCVKTCDSLSGDYRLLIEKKNE